MRNAEKMEEVRQNGKIWKEIVEINLVAGLERNNIVRYTNRQ